jgi:SAM-dependent methyltransferase
MKAQHVMGVVAAGFVADALWRRRRAARLPCLPPSTEPLAGTHLFVTVAGVELDEATRRAAVAYARGEGLKVLDLVPQRLDALRAMAAACAQPYLATLGTPLRPHDRYRFALCRPVTAPYRWLSVAATADEPDPDLPRLREEFAAELAGGVSRFHEPRRADCPWCGGVRLRRLLTSGDLQHHRPGVFRLDRCRSCGHIFQNPRLSVAGLNFHYKEFYDGNGGGEVERGFRLGAPHYRDRAKMLRGHATPDAWLDVGGGHGHFCNAARDVWPRTRFDALDMSRSVEEAARQGWIDRGHLGFFPQLADELAGSYDVVSMHHYLEHTVDPYAELDAAAKVLPPGGHLLIEVPDPEWPLGRLAGRWWHCWFQPQHLNLIPMRNLVDALADRGLETVEVHRGEAHHPLDLTMIVMLMVHRLVPDPNKPWRFEPHQRLRVAARAAAFLAGAPLIMTGGNDRPAGLPRDPEMPPVQRLPGARPKRAMTSPDTAGRRVDGRRRPPRGRRHHGGRAAGRYAQRGLPVLRRPGVLGGTGRRARSGAETAADPPAHRRRARGRHPSGRRRHRRTTAGGRAGTPDLRRGRRRQRLRRPGPTPRWTGPE